MESECVEMDLSTRSRERTSQENCKMRVAKSVFSIRSLVDVGDGTEKLDENNENTTNGELNKKLNSASTAKLFKNYFHSLKFPCGTKLNLNFNFEF